MYLTENSLFVIDRTFELIFASASLNSRFNKYNCEFTNKNTLNVFSYERKNDLFKISLFEKERSPIILDLLES